MMDEIKPGDIVIWRFWSRDVGYLDPKPGVVLFRDRYHRLGVAYCTSDRAGRRKEWSIGVAGSGLSGPTVIRVDRVDVREPDETVKVIGRLANDKYDEVMNMRDEYDAWRREQKEKAI